MTSKLTYSSRGLNEDCTKVVPGATTADHPVESADLRGRLRNFAAIPAVEFVGQDARISLTGKGQEFVASNEGGQLFLVQAPAAKNSAVPRSPDEIVQLLDDEFSPASPEVEEEVVITTGKARDKFGSPKLLMGLVAVWAVIAFFVLAPEGPEGVTLVDDSAREANFAQQVEGRYGDAGPEGEGVFVVQDGRLRVFLTSADGVDVEPSLDEAFAFGHRDGELVLVVENGAILSRDETGALTFEDEVYPRLP